MIVCRTLTLQSGCGDMKTAALRPQRQRTPAPLLDLRACGRERRPVNCDQSPQYRDKPPAGWVQLETSVTSSTSSPSGFSFVSLRPGPVRSGPAPPAAAAWWLVVSPPQENYTEHVEWRGAAGQQVIGCSDCFQWSCRFKGESVLIREETPAAAHWRRTQRLRQFNIRGPI